MTKHLPILPTLVGLALILVGLHFGINAVEYRILGGLYLGYGTIIHIRNVRICRQMWIKQRTIL